MTEHDDKTCATCPQAVAEAVHALLDEVVGEAKAWLDDPSTVRWFVASGAPAALEAHGYRFESHPGGGCLLERAKRAATPADLFLQMYEVTGDRSDWVAAVDVRGRWLAEHVSLPMKERDDGAKLLASMDGVSRGRVKGVKGGVLRGVRALRALTLPELEQGFAA